MAVYDSDTAGVAGAEANGLRCRLSKAAAPVGSHVPVDLPAIDSVAAFLSYLGLTRPRREVVLGSSLLAVKQAPRDDIACFWEILYSGGIHSHCTA